MHNHYDTLGISDSASQQEIKTAFKKLAVQFHPDKHGGNDQMEERFKQINEAYQTLSNPYEKARYDLQRQFGHRSTYTSPQPRYYQQNGPRKPYVEPRINWRENWIATGYAFAFTIVVAILVMSAIGIKRYFDTKTLQEKLAHRRAAFEEIQADYQEGKVEAALIHLNDLGIFRTDEQDMREFKEHLYIEFLDKAERQFRAHNFSEAIHYYELIIDYGPRTTQILHEHLAQSYNANQQIQKAISKYSELILNNYHPLESYLALAQIFDKTLQQPEEAIKYYELASKRAIASYKSIFGDAYPLVISGQSVPDEHYYLYTGLADAYLKTGNPDRALKAIKWNVSMWPDSSANYVTAAQAFYETGKQRRACNALAIARRLGYEERLNIGCGF